ncbi:hypothetical protein Q9Q99_12160 [Curtobacterium flaccumfaciens]|nr:hypothetical protein Q9Q99_12160 [Curtobacterium flaccumfaciens]
MLVGVGTFYIWPIIQTFWYSFTSWGVFGSATFTGVANYVRLVGDPQLYQSLLNTVIYTAVVLAGIPIAVWLASLLNTPGLRFAQFYRGALLPAVRRHARGDRAGLAHHVQQRLRHRELVPRGTSASTARTGSRRLASRSSR